jgi:glycerol kinase
VSILVIDVGTSGLRSAIVNDDGTVAWDRHRELLPDTPAPGLVEFDAEELAAAALELAAAALEATGPVTSVGIANQRASTIVWDRSTGRPVGPALGWQDLRTVGDCLVLQADGLRFAPNQSATKVKHLLDAHDPDRVGDLCVGTVDSWLAWTLSDGALHVIDASNAAVTGLVTQDGSDWDRRTLEQLAIPERSLPEIVDSTGHLGEAAALAGSPPICGIAGDQQASLVGQGCVAPGQAKATFGTGGMLDLVIGHDRPSFDTQGGGGTFPIVTWRRGAETMWGVEAIMLSAGSNVEWLRDDLGIIDSAEQSHELAASCDDTGGVVYVPALLGLGTPRWDYGARGTLLGVTRGTGRAQLARAVLEGVAQRGADLLDAAEADGGQRISSLRVDGGMSANATFVQALADACQRPIEVSPVVDATTLGAAFLAGLADGTWASWDDIGAVWEPARIVPPTGELDRDRWAEAIDRSLRWEPGLSGLSF